MLHRSDSEDYAHRLYAELRRLDTLGVDVLVAEKPISDPIGRAVLDRLQRAEHGSKLYQIDVFQDQPSAKVELMAVY